MGRKRQMHCFLRPESEKSETNATRFPKKFTLRPLIKSSKEYMTEIKYILRTYICTHTQLREVCCRVYLTLIYQNAHNNGKMRAETVTHINFSAVL